MYNRILLSFLFCVSLSGCSILNTKKEDDLSNKQIVVKTEYIKKPKLVLPQRERPVMTSIEWKVEKSNVYLTRKYFESLLVDLVNLQSYIESLQADLESYKSYYETD